MPKYKLNDKALEILVHAWTEDMDPPRWWNDAKVAALLPPNELGPVRAMDLRYWRYETGRSLGKIKRGGRASTLKGMKKQQAREKALDKEMEQRIKAAKRAARAKK